MRLPALVVILLAALVSGGQAATAPAEKVATGSRDGWTASLRYTLTGPQSFREIVGLRISVRHSGRAVFARALPLPKACRVFGCTRLGFTGFHFFELDDLGVGQPVALIWLWTGGAHCCTVLALVSLADGRMVDRNFGNPGASVIVVDGEPRLVSADDRFAYLFTSYAASGFPLRIWRYDGARLVDVTRAHPSAVRVDAGEYWRAYVEQRQARAGETRGMFAAWAADTCLLGGEPKVERMLAHGLRHGFFSGAAASDVLGPKGATYAKALRSRLRAFRYCK